MFETLDDLREKPAMKRWHIALMVLCVVLWGVNVGMLIGARNWTWEKWLVFGANGLLSSFWLVRVVFDSMRFKEQQAGENGH